VGRPDGRRLLKDVFMDGRAILRAILNKENG